jgi:hypothetical protein
MNYLKLLNVVVLSCFLAGCAGSIRETGYLQEYGHQGGRGQGFRSSPYLVGQESHTCVSGEISGRIVGLRVETFARDLEPGLAVEIQTPDQGLLHVHCGPLKVLQRQESGLKPGDEVAMKVYCFRPEGGQESLFAGEITHNGQNLILRDAQGNPVWNISRKK